MNEEIKNFFIKTILIVVSILIIYFVISPYQNCERLTSGTGGWCIENKNW
jgi:hypothetical protein